MAVINKDSGMIGKTISHYTILDKLGEGGMGVVYKARDERLGRLVALKFLSPLLTRDEGFKERFVHEARAASSLDHINICTVYEIDETGDGRLFMSMPYYEGETIGEKLTRGALAPEEATDIVAQAARGLARAHAAGIVHRDIKPANLMVTADGVVKILDFGLAKEPETEGMTRTGTTVGTVAYMSPEQIRGEAVDHRSDVWALGVVLYEMLSGELPFKGEYEQAISYAIVNEQPELITRIRHDLPARTAPLLDRLLSKRPEERFQTMAEMSEALGTMAEDLNEGQLTVFSLWRGYRRIIRRAFAVILVVTIGFGAHLWWVRVADGTHVSIALLPLESIARDSEQAWLSDGMTDALITELANISGLRIISRSSVMQYKGTHKSPPQIAVELGVAYVIEGSVVKVGDQVRVSARLIDAPRDRYVWGQEYERALGNVLALQGEIAQAIADQVRVKLTPRERTRLTTVRPVNPEAYEAYLKGMFHANQYTPEGFEKAFGYLREAIEKDPAHPLPYANLALALNVFGHGVAPPPGVFPQAKAAALKALELDETVAEAHAALGEIRLVYEWDWPGAEQAFRRALELNPNIAVAHRWYGWYLLLMGRKDEAISEIKRARDLDPVTPVWTAWLGWFYWVAGEDEEAINMARKSLELNPDLSVGFYVLGCVYAEAGRYQEAIAAHQRAADISRFWGWGLGISYAMAGRKDEARKIAGELEKGTPYPLYKDRNVKNPWGLAEIYTALGEKDRAFRWLEAGFAQRQSWMPWIGRNPNFKPLQGDTRFQALLRRMDLPD